MAREVSVNLELLKHALYQTGPWKDQKISVSSEWLLEQLEIKITAMNWEAVKQDVVRFLRPREMATLELWSKEFFLSRLGKLSGYLRGGLS